MGITSNDIAAQRAMLARGEEKRKAIRQAEERERLRDTFAAAALTGYTANPAWDDVAASIVAEQAYADADAMLRERDKQSVGVSEMDSESDRKSVAAHGACARSCSQPFDSAPTTQPAPPRVETDGFSPGSRSGQINRSPERQSPDRECGESPLRDVSQLDNSRAAGGPEQNTQEPVAWAVCYAHCDTGIVALLRTLDECRQQWSNRTNDYWRYEPLYRHPPCQDLSQKNFTLTDEEREVLEHEVELAEYQQRHELAATLRNLLERLK